jgi:predicted ferric reductase
MDKRIRTYNRIAATVVFFIVPLLLYGLGNFPRRALYKELLSLMTITAFFGLLMQFYLSRANKGMLQGFKMSGIIKWHKTLGYIFLGILFFHPFFVILYHLFQPGLTFSEAFTEVIDNFNKTGLLLGLIAWILMIVIGLMAIFRKSIFKNYRTWRLWHGGVSLAFITLAAIHAIDIGRHMNLYMSLFIAVILVIATYKLFTVYLIKRN